MQADKYTIRVWADFRSTGLLDYWTGDNLDPEDVGLSPELRARLSKWVAAYQPLIPISDRSHLMDRIDELDAEGLEIARDVLLEVGERYYVCYYSEGRCEDVPLHGGKVFK